MKKSLAATVVLAALAVSACEMPVEGSPSRDEGKVRATSSAPAPEGTTADVPATSDAPVEPPPTTTAEVDSGAIPIGEGVYEYADGLTVEVSALGLYTPSEYAAGADAADSAITFVVTVANGSAEAVDLAITTVNVNAGALGNRAEQIYDAELGFGFEGSVLPGKVASAQYAFAVNAADLGELVIEIEPGFLTYDSAYFEGSLA